ncbi:hypothetical protein AAHC03_020660 [Spirometra sp. Aus1]
MEFSILKINGRSVGPSEAMEALRRTEDPVAVEIVRRCGRNTDEPSAAAAAALYLPGDCSILIGGSGGLCTTSGSELSCCCTCPPARHSSRSVGVQTALSATEMIASAAILAASRAAEEARIALGIPVIGGYHHSPLSFRDPIIDDPTFLNRCRPPVDPLSEEVNPIESTYANFPDFPERTTGLGSEFSTGSKPESNSCDTQDSQPPELSEILGGAPLEWTYFNVLLQRNSPNEKFGLTLVYRPSCLQSNSTEVYVGEIEEGSVSERSGLISTGDRIVKINDQEIESREHVIELFAECCQNAKISLMRPRRSGSSYRPPPPPPSYPLLGGSLPLTKEAELRSDFRGRVSDPKMTTNAYAHLPDQDSGMGRTTDESVRTAESSEQEGESDPGCKLANATDKLNWTALTTGGFLGSDHEPKENNAAVNGNQKKAGIKSQKKDLVDAELVRLSHLMQSLALHCSNLAYVKRLYSSALQRDNQQETAPQTAPFTAAVSPPSTPAATPAASALLPPRCTPRMGTRREGGGPAGGLQRAGKANSEGWFSPAGPTDANMETVQASNCEKTSRVETCSTSSSTSAMALPSLSDGQRLCATDIVSPDLATSLPTLANSTAPAAVDLAADSTGLSSRLSMGRGPSSIWSLPEPTGPFSEESLLPRLGAPPPRFPFPRTGATTANASPAQVKIASRRLTNRSCERVGQVKLASEASGNGDSNNSLVGSNLKSHSGQGSCSGDSGRGFYPRQHPNSPIKHGCISTLVSLSSAGHQYSNNLASLPQSPQHHPPLPYYTSSSDVPVAKPRPSECQSPPCPPPPLPYPPLQPIPPAASPFWHPRGFHNLGPAPLFPFPPPLGLHPYELYDHFFPRAAHPSTINDPNHVSATQDGPTEECKYSDVLSNIYETPYAYADMVDTTKEDVGKDCTGVTTAVSSGANEQMSSLYHLPGGVFPHNWYEGHAVGVPSLVGVGNPGYTHHPDRTAAATGGATSPAVPPPLMEWVVKKRTDGTRYITRRPIRNKSIRTRSRHQVEERCGLTTDDDAQSELKFGRYWNRIERKKHVEKAKVERRRRPGAGVVDEASEQSRDPTNSKSSSRSQNSTDRCLVSLTTV